MRIDLIPDVPVQPVKGKKKRVVVSAPTKTQEPYTETTSQEGSITTTAFPQDSGFEALLQSIYDAAIITDTGGQVLDVNMRAMGFFQYSRSEFRNITIFDVISGADKELLNTLLQNLQNERFVVIEAYCERHDGTFFPAEIAVNKLKLDKEEKLCFFIRDITIRRQEREMLLTEHNAIQNSGNGIAVANLDWQMEYINPAVLKMWGYEKAEDLIGVDVRTLLVEQELVEEMIRSVAMDHKSWFGEMKGKRKDGTTFDLQVSVTGNRNSDGELVGTVFSFIDISDRKKAEEALREAERHRVMLESLGAACHHLGQPATVLLANLGIMQKHLEGANDELIKELIQNSIGAAERLGEILHRLNTVNEYKTTRYLETSTDADSPENRILQI